MDHLGNTNMDHLDTPPVLTIVPYIFLYIDPEFRPQNNMGPAILVGPGM